MEHTLEKCETNVYFTGGDVYFCTPPAQRASESKLIQPFFGLSGKNGVRKARRGKKKGSWVKEDSFWVEGMEEDRLTCERSTTGATCNVGPFDFHLICLASLFQLHFWFFTSWCLPAGAKERAKAILSF